MGNYPGQIADYKLTFQGVGKNEGWSVVEKITGGHFAIEREQGYEVPTWLH